MALAVSALSATIDAVADRLKSALDAATQDIQVLVATPADAASAWTDELHQVSIFIFRIEPDEFDPGGGPGDVQRIRAQCFISVRGMAVTGANGSAVSAGENEIRLLGQVVRTFNEQPILPPIVADGETFRPRIVPRSIGLDELNQLWSVQGDATARPAVAYEIALVPVVPSTRTVPAPRVGSPIFEARGDMMRMDEPTARLRTVRPEGPVLVKTVDEHWAPYICLVHVGSCHEHLVFEVDAAPDSPLSTFQPQVWIAGLTGAAVELHWQVWESSSGWTDHPDVLAAAPSGDTVSPDDAASATTTDFALPFKDRPAQFVLFASRVVGGATVRSNPVFVNLKSATP